ADAAPPAAARGQHEIEMVDDLGNAAIVEQPHPDDEPHYVVGGEFPPPHRRSACRRQCGGDPLRINRRTDLPKLAGPSPAPPARLASPPSIAPPPVGETIYYLFLLAPLWRKDPDPRHLHARPIGVRL